MALVLVAVASLTRWGIGQVFPAVGPYAIFFPAVLIAALLGGWRAGLAAAVLSLAVIWRFFLHPAPVARLTDPQSPGNLAIVAGAVSILIAVGAYARSLVGRLEASNLALADRNLEHDALFEAMSEGLALCEAILDEDGHLADYTIIEMNRALRSMLQVGPEAIGTRLSDGGGADDRAWLRMCERVLRSGRAESFEFQNPTTHHWFEVRVTRVSETRMAQLFFDVTERRRAEVRQSELFDELNHRVSNNLTLVSGILEMKAKATEVAEVRDQLQRAVARVDSIAQVHRTLYRGARKDDVDFAAYLHDLCAGIRQSLIHDDRVAVNVEAEPAILPIDTVIPLGMVVNELITNAIKYAYPAPQRGVISVSFARTDDGLRLFVGDSGRGLPNDPEGHSGGLGMKLVQSLVAQVNGEMTVRRHPGTSFEITLPSGAASGDAGERPAA